MELLANELLVDIVVLGHQNQLSMADGIRAAWWRACFRAQFRHRFRLRVDAPRGHGDRIPEGRATERIAVDHDETRGLRRGIALLAANDHEYHSHVEGAFCTKRHEHLVNPRYVLADFNDPDGETGGVRARPVIGI